MTRRVTLLPWQAATRLSLRPPAVANTKETLNVLIDEARRAGVQRIVFVSVAGAGDNKMVPHHATEQHLKAGPQDWTILRPGFFAQNIATAYRADIVEDDRIYLPAGKGKVAFIDLRDMGVVAADVLTDMERHAGETYTLTGPAVYTFDEVAEILTGALGRAIRYDAASIVGYYRHLRGRGVPGTDFIQTILHAGLRFGQADIIDPTLEQLLGYRPHDVEQYICDHADLWAKVEPHEAISHVRCHRFRRTARPGHRRSCRPLCRHGRRLRRARYGGGRPKPAACGNRRLHLPCRDLRRPGRSVIIVLHGGPGGDYRSLMGLQVLADEYFVVFYDQRGSGLSERVPAEEFSFQVMLKDLDSIVDLYGKGEPVHLVGHSWGGMLASGYLGYAPDKVDKAVMAEPGFLNVQEAADWRAVLWDADVRTDLLLADAAGRLCRATRRRSGRLRRAKISSSASRSCRCL